VEPETSRIRALKAVDLVQQDSIVLKQSRVVINNCIVFRSRRRDALERLFARQVAETTCGKSVAGLASE
jgi:hypothetical protein